MSDENMGRARRWVEPCVGDWWNDSCRKTWRRAFDDPGDRSLLLNDLTDVCARALAAAVRTMMQDIYNARPISPTEADLIRFAKWLRSHMDSIPEPPEVEP